MTSANGSTWSATIPASSIKRSVTAPATGSVTFVAAVPGGGVTTAKLTVVAKPTFVGNCTVAPTPIALRLLTTLTQNAETLSCTTSGLSAGDTVTVSYPTSIGTSTGTLTSANGTSWQLVLPAGTRVKGAPTQTFTFSLTRVSDGMAGTPQTITAVAA
jgi:hypothetical protein